MKKNVYYNPSAKDLTAKWYLLDAKGQRLGKVASKAAMLLMGKHTPEYVPHLDNGGRVVIINAAEIDVHPSKVDGKIYYHHTGHPGGIRQQTLGTFMDSKPTEVMRKAVRGMLPKNRLGEATMGKLYIYSGAEHDQVAQKPEEVTL